MRNFGVESCEIIGLQERAQWMGTTESECNKFFLGSQSHSTKRGASVKQDCK